MKQLKLLLLALTIVFSTASFTDVAEVYTWKAFPGKGVDMMQSMAKAAAIHESQGAKVSINAHNVGSTQLYDYVLRWDDSASYAQSKDLQASSPEWVEFWAESASNPSGEMVKSFSGNNLDTTVKASDYDGSYVYSVSLWTVNPGKDMEMIARFMEAKSILEAAGARVELYQGGWGAVDEYHFVLMYDSWVDLESSFSKMGPGTAWSEYMEKSASLEVIGTRTAYFTGQTVQSN